jgi:GT2 family glycosyltransferase
MKCTICIVNYQSIDDTEKCIRSIAQHAGDIAIEIIVVDNNSDTDEIINFQQRWKQQENLTIVLSPENVGFGQGNELGISIAKGEYFLILNPDIEVTENSIQSMIRHMDEQRDIGIVGPRLKYEDGAIQDSYRRFPKALDVIIKRTALKHIPIFKKRLSHFLMWDKNPETIEDVDWLVGGALMIRRDSLKDLKTLFDKRFFLFFEDTDLCRRMWEQGWRVTYFPKAVMNHHHERLSEGSVLDIFTKKTVRIHIASGIKYFWKYLLK